MFLNDSSIVQILRAIFEKDSEAGLRRTTNGASRVDVDIVNFHRVLDERLQFQCSA